MIKKLLSPTTTNFLAGLLLVIAILHPLFSHAQAEDKSLPLKEVLQLLQARYGASFNYADEKLVGIYVKVPSITADFSQALAYVQAQTPLIFKITSENIVVVIADKKYWYDGKIQDLDTGSPIAFADIKAKFTGAISDSLGRFRIELYGSDSLLAVSHVGYGNRQYKIKLANGEVLELRLKSNPKILQEVIIDDLIVRGIAKKPSGSFYIDFQDFSILPGLIKSDVLQAIQALPGIISANETVSNINIRGGSNDQNLLLWDGIKMYQSGHFFGLISMFNPDMTQRVNVVRNGTNAALTDGVSGTVSMQTKEEINREFQGKVGVDFLNAAVFTDIPLGKKSSIQIAGRKSHSELFKTPTYNEYFDRITQNTELANNQMNVFNSDINFDFYDIALRALVNLNARNRLRINFIFSKNNLIYNESAMISGDTQSRESSLGQRSIAEGIYFERAWNKQWTSVVHIYETDYKLKAINANVLENQRFLQENIISETGARTETTRHGSNYNWTNGYHFVETKITNIDDVDIPIFRTLEGKVIRTHGLYSQLNFTANYGRLTINPGLRLNYIEKFDRWRLEPRLNITYATLHHLTFELQAESKHQNSSQIINFQNDFLGIEKRRWQLSNEEDIPIITSQQLSAGIVYENHGLLVSTEAYYKQVNGITSQSQGFQTKYEFVKSAGNYEVSGIDVLIRKKLQKFFLWAGYSYMDNKYTFETLQEQTFPSNFDIRHALTAGSNYETGPLKISMGINWRTGSPLSIPLAGDEISDDKVNFGPANNERLPDYVRLDFSIAYEALLSKNRKLNFSASLWNLLNTNNTIGKFYRSDENELISIEEQSLGITPNVLIQYFF